MIGTIVNTVTIITGSTVGALLKKGIKPQYSGALFTAMGLAATGLGINAVVQNMPKSVYPVLFIASLAIGCLVGTVIDIDKRFQDLTLWIQNRPRKGGYASDTFDAAVGSVDAASGDGPAWAAAQDGGCDGASTGAPIVKENRLGEGLSTGILLYCIGTLSILGPIQSALYGDNTYLFTNATLDLVTSAVLASTYGIGMILAAPVLFCWQGAIYLLATLLGDFMSAELMTEISIVGGFLIASSGISILKIKDIKTLNMLPALLVPVVWVILRGLF